jgi:hypothetical protein
MSCLVTPERPAHLSSPASRAISSKIFRTTKPIVLGSGVPLESFGVAASGLRVASGFGDIYCIRCDTHVRVCVRIVSFESSEAFVSRGFCLALCFFSRDWTRAARDAKAAATLEKPEWTADDKSRRRKIHEANSVPFAVATTNLSSSYSPLYLACLEKSSTEFR